ncbi:MAG: efflux RND transporter periplasmic adaptor subunit [Bacteroidales bacterium]|nr:efflux RND transporter periplasmic adaptor subunit [Bacteroidales bacterium]MBN2820430.1 efflux RND transporter periplasmic adaptor subunit [Bacteroidales bacterium]
MNRKRLIYIGAAVILAVVLFLVFKPKKNNTKLILTTEKVKMGEINEVITATGTLEALQTVEVGTQVSGVIQKIYVDYNSIVKKGQLIAQIDETPLIASLEQSKASVDNAEAEFNYQKSNYERYKVLADKKLIAETDFEMAEYNFRKASASLKNAKSNYDKTKINLDYAKIYSPIDGVVLDKAVDEGQTVAASFSTPTMFTIANDLTQMQVEADVDEADIGQLKVDQRVEFTVDAYPDLNFNGQVTQIRMQPVETSNVVTYTVIIQAPNPEKKLLPGMTANVSFYVKEKKDILLVAAKGIRFQPIPPTILQYQKQNPEISWELGFPGQEPNQNGEKTQGMPEMPDSIKAKFQSGSFPPQRGKMAQGIPSTDKKIVWVKVGNTISKRMVKTGDTDEVYYEVISGLNEGDEVVTGLNSGATPFTMPTNMNGTRSPFMPTPPGRNR